MLIHQYNVIGAGIWIYIICTAVVMAFEGLALIAVIVVGVVFLVGFYDLDRVRAATRKFEDAEVPVIRVK